MSQERTSSPRKVFISHSHRDRHAATDLQTTLEQHGAETYLDQEKIRAGDVLPDRIREGITWCDTFLMIWSPSAASSEWVQHECNMAYDLRKKIVPYILDSAPLPRGFENLVYIELKDRKLGDAQLLTTVFGREFTPDPTTLFPGWWRASMDAFGMIQATYDLKLRENGQMDGEGGADLSGVAGQLSEQMGMGGLLTMRIQVHGSWSYDLGTQLLTLVLIASGFGQQTHDTVNIRTTGREKQAIRGQDLEGRTWSLERLKRQRNSVNETVHVQTSQEIYSKGIALWSSGNGYSDPHLAFEYFTQAIGLDPNHGNIYHARGLAQHQLGRFTEAISDFDRAISLYPYDAEYYNARGNAYYALNKLGEARKDWENACKKGSKHGCDNLKRYL